MYVIDDNDESSSLLQQVVFFFLLLPQSQEENHMQTSFLSLLRPPRSLWPFVKSPFVREKRETWPEILSWLVGEVYLTRGRFCGGSSSCFCQESMTKKGEVCGCGGGSGVAVYLFPELSSLQGQPRPS